MEQIVHAVERKATYTPHEHRDKYMLREERGYVWLQNALFWILRKLRCYAVYDQVSYSYCTIHTGKFMERLYRQRREIVAQYNRCGDRLYIGAEDFQELMNESVGLNFPFDFVGQYRDGPRLMGMQVTVVPWMRGMFIAPK